jgi:sugar/nucleoside kinase (ribokinase family)
MPSGNLRARRREHEEFFSKKISVSREARPEEEFCTPLSSLHSLGPKIVCITDGPRGAYMNAPEGTFFMPPYPDPAPPKNRTGAGDAFAATFVSYLALGKTPQEALRRAPINSAFVVQHIGAQKGLLTKAQLEQYLTTAPEDFSPQKL